MAWYDDSWRDGYDAWKLASPDDDYDDEPREDDCDHEDYEADIVTGRAMCHRCGHQWWQTPEEVRRETEHQANYQRLEARWKRWQWWRDLKDRVWSLVPRRRHVHGPDDAQAGRTGGKDLRRRR
jgi:hypothetical protein